jgi:hypothetical protein
MVKELLMYNPTFGLLHPVWIDSRQSDRGSLRLGDVVAHDEDGSEFFAGRAIVCALISPRNQELVNVWKESDMVIEAGCIRLGHDGGGYSGSWNVPATALRPAILADQIPPRPTRIAPAAPIAEPLGWDDPLPDTFIA